VTARRRSRVRGAAVRGGVVVGFGAAAVGAERVGAAAVGAAAVGAAAVVCLGRGRRRGSPALGSSRTTSTPAIVARRAGSSLETTPATTTSNPSARSVATSRRTRLSCVTGLRTSTSAVCGTAASIYASPAATAWVVSAPMTAREDAERDRLRGVFARYADDRRRRRGWAAENPGNIALREELAQAVLAEFARSDPGGTLVDLGCGTGWWLARLAGAGYPARRLLGVELLEDRVRAARSRVPGAGVDVGDVRAPAAPAGSCALITLFTVLSSMPTQADVDETLTHACQMLQPGGMIAVWEPRVWTPNRDTRLVGRRQLHAALGDTTRIRSLTVAPPLARRAAAAYPALARLAPLRSHRLVTARPR
jgi:SAM-dependent methyltransferase